MGKISENLQKIDFDTSNTRLIAVSKYVDSEKIIEAYNAGLRNFAESKAQNAEIKRSEIPEDIEKDIIWHYIGHLQTNKIKKVVGKYEFIHSVDSLKLAKQISEYAASNGIIQKVLIQVNTTGEETKFGFDVKTAKEAFAELLNLDSLDIKGFMTMAPYTEDENIIHKAFRDLRGLRDELQEKYGKELPELSMGMSNDYHIAIEEGSTMIRLGSFIFS